MTKVIRLSKVVVPTLTLLRYLDADGTKPEPALSAEIPEPAPPVAPPSGASEEEVRARIADAVAKAQQTWSLQADAHKRRSDEQVRAALDEFAKERTAYFRKAEREIVNLVLAISRKILQREASLDPTLLGALVRTALDRMETGSTVRIRLHPEELDCWQKSGKLEGTAYECALVPDEELPPGACVVETELGVADFGYEAQFKVIEDSILQLISARPGASQAS